MVENVGGPCAAPDELIRVYYTPFDRVFYALSNGVSIVYVPAIINVLGESFDFRANSRFLVGTQLRAPTTGHWVIVER